MPSAAQSISDQSAIDYYKAFVNFIKIQSKLYADKVFVRYHVNKSFKTLTYSQVDHITTNLACEWAKQVEGSGVISYISDHSIDYLLTMIALMKLRSTLLAVSPRNSKAAIVNLLEKTNSKVFFTSPKYEAIAKSASVKIEGVSVIVVNPFDIEALLNQPLNDRQNEFIDTSFTEKDLNKPALIIHRYVSPLIKKYYEALLIFYFSSGTTNYPKPIYLTNRYVLNLCGVFKLCKEQNPHLDLVKQSDVFLTCVPL